MAGDDSDDLVAASCTATGARRWFTTSGTAAADAVSTIAWDPVANQLHLAGYTLLDDFLFRTTLAVTTLNGDDGSTVASFIRSRDPEQSSEATAAVGDPAARRLYVTGRTAPDLDSSQDLLTLAFAIS